VPRSSLQQGPKEKTRPSHVSLGSRRTGYWNEGTTPGSPQIKCPKQPLGEASLPAPQPEPPGRPADRPPEALSILAHRLGEPRRCSRHRARSSAAPCGGADRCVDRIRGEPRARSSLVRQLLCHVPGTAAPRSLGPFPCGLLFRSGLRQAACRLAAWDGSQAMGPERGCQRLEAK
jgi:hypothetical protein